jgi:4a-hydroxytetrahydrobiopterin dehydratase
MSMTTLADLLAKQCHPIEHESTSVEIATALSLLTQWQLIDGNIARQFDFKNYHQTLAFVNAIAVVIHAEDHHPELLLTYNRCIVKFHTHSVNQGNGGISENDFICAAKVDAIFQPSLA